MTRQLKYVSEELQIELSINYSHRKTLSIKLKPNDPVLYVSAPVGMRDSDIICFVGRKTGWINKKLLELQKPSVQARTFTDGSTHYYLGSPFTLRVQEGRNNVSFDGTEIRVTSKNTGEEAVKKLLYKWYAQRAEEIFPQILSPVMTRFGKNRKAMPSRIEYKLIKSYWGQCSSKGLIRMNIELIRAPKECREMIFTHELCHLVHRNHSKRFYDLLTDEYPNWKRELRYLKENVSCRY